MTKEQLHSCMPNATAENLEKFFQPLSEAMERFQINTFERSTIFMAQVAHESGSLRYTREIATGEHYENRKDLGNDKPGDGPKYLGRGLVQITGKRNYALLGDYFKQPFVEKPELLEGPVWACQSAGWYWFTKGLNTFADMPMTWSKLVRFKNGDKLLNSFEYITYRINGGLNGLKQRLEFYELAKISLKQ